MPDRNSRMRRLTLLEQRTIATLRRLEFTIDEISQVVCVPYNAASEFISNLPEEKARRQRIAEEIASRAAEKARRAQVAKIPREQRLRIAAAARREDLAANYWPEIEKIEAQRWEPDANSQNVAARA